MRATTIVFICCVLLLGCKPDEKPIEQTQAKSEPEQAKVEWVVPITTESQEGTTLGVPMLEVGVRDHRTRMVLDTSSHYNTLTRTFASTVRAPVSSSKQITRVQGKLDQAVKVEGVVAMNFGDREWRLENVVASESLAQTDTWGIGGLLAPLQFVDFAHALIADFRGGKVYLLKGGENHVLAWFESQFGKPSAIGVTADDDGLLYVETSIDPESKARTLAILDSGSAHSRFSDAFLNVKPQEDECVEGLDPFGGCIPGRVVGDQSIELGGTWFTGRKIAAVPAASGHPRMQAEGAIGMDVLKHCTFAFTSSTEKIWAVCDPQ